METITLEPFRIMFCNVNKAMGLTGHCHYAEVILEFETLGAIGFPSFKETVEEVKNHLQGLKLKGFKGTNEEVLRHINAEMQAFPYEACKKYGGSFRLHSTTLKVMGVQDENNHSDGFTTYRKTNFAP